jgi:nitrile hydratase accessory protein
MNDKPSPSARLAGGGDSDPSALDSLPGLPRDQEGPVFREPWEAQAFAMALQLHERGLFSWTEWARELAAQIETAQAHGDPDHGDSYYHHWLAALESLVAQKGASSSPELARYQRGWERAASRTAHGAPIELAPPDLEE